MATKSLGKLLVGKCLPCVKPKTTKVAVPTMDLDSNLLMYFRKVDYLYADDPDGRCKTGDIVLVEELKRRKSKLATHRVMRVVYPMGDVTDPITGKKISTGRLRDDVAEETRLYGRSPNGFDYDKAPPRGWQEGARDFTDKETYIKYQEVEGDDQPYAY